MKKLICLCIFLAGCTTFQTTINVPPSAKGDNISAYVLYYNCGNREVPVDLFRGMLRDAQVQAQQEGVQGDQQK